MEVHLPEILEALRQGQHDVKLKDGSRGILPQDWVDRFASMAELGKAEGEAHPLPLLTGSAAGCAAGGARPGDHRLAPFAGLRENLRSFNGVGPAAEPAGFSGELRQYQKVGLGWLHFLEGFRLGGCLADDMGLGKTVQVLALLESAAPRPANTKKAAALVGRGARSLVFNWIEEAWRFTPKLRMLDHTGLQRGHSTEDFADYDLVLTTYGTLRRDTRPQRHPFDYAILDEAQAIKNADRSGKAAPATGRHASP